MTNRLKRLELTWIGKDDRPRLEPRILLEHQDLACAKRVSNEDIFDNRLVHGDNLLALKALENEFAGRIKCVYIDPPFNTGDMFENYDDGLEHSIWLGLMRERLELLHKLLRADGSIFVHLNDDEVDYCKVILDEIFGRSNFVNRITVAARSPSAFSTVNPGVFKSSEYILWYARDKGQFSENQVRVRRAPDYAYSKWLENPDDAPSRWTFTTLMEAYTKEPPPRSRRPDSALEHFHSFIVQNANRVCRLASISDTGAGEATVALKRASLGKPDRVFVLKREGDLDDVYVLNGQQLIFYSKNVAIVDGERTASAMLTNIWTDIAWEGIANEGGVTFRKGKKPERLIKRCLELATSPGDWVLDSFAGSGTTGAVAHKMRRRWLMIELGEHATTHIRPRMAAVVDGSDASGISTFADWKGGGGFRFFKLAPSLLEKDKWGNWIVSKQYKPEMLAEAMCKLEGFRYAPDPEAFWNHGHSTERDFIYITTQNLSSDQLRFISEQVGPERTLLICCGAFRGKPNFPNLTVKKIPQAVLARCEWGRDDYSLNVAEQAPVVAVEESKAEASTSDGTKTKAGGRRKKATPVQALPLFAGIDNGSKG